MNSRERVLKVLDGQMPDRVPVMEIFIDPKVIDSICPGMSHEDFIDYAEVDCVTCLTMADSPENISWVDKEKKIFRDKWGALQQLTEEVIPVQIEPARIQTENDLKKYQPPDPAKSPVFGYVRKLVKRFKGKRAIAVVGEAAFAPAQYLRSGLANLMLDFVMNPAFAKKLLQIGVDYHIELYKRLIKNEGVEIVVLGDDYAYKNGPFMSPQHFEQFILPCLKTVVKAIKDAGGFVIKHTDGDIWKIVDMIVSSGVDMLGPLEPAYMQLDKVRSRFKNKVGVLGNIDIDLLSTGTTEQVKAATIELIKRVSPSGGHIVSSGNSISSSVKGENFMAMIKTVKEFGKYPISLK
ncbi:MAG: hypothetical protein A2Y13_04395 [Planctomycetes bacterium GWC2_45_44]|nr:MAG: hypothetical protein A2Y13_04395 [Planctomycetes bacterium GWC2_45_44]HBR19435.1 hypothetical protein [Phycisphaerales bacterium]